MFRGQTTRNLQRGAPAVTRPAKKHSRERGKGWSDNKGGSTWWCREQMRCCHPVRNRLGQNVLLVTVSVGPVALGREHHADGVSEPPWRRRITPALPPVRRECDGRCCWNSGTPGEPEAEADSAGNSVGGRIARSALRGAHLKRVHSALMANGSCCFTYVLTFFSI